MFVGQAFQPDTYVRLESLTYEVIPGCRLRGPTLGNRAIILWGASGHALVLQEFLRDIGFDLIALFDNNPTIVSPIKEVPLYHGTSGFEKWSRGRELRNLWFAVAIGGARGKERFALYQYLSENGLRPATLVHPASFVAKTASVAEGCQILAQASVCACANLGEACIINTRASVDHECILGKGVHVAPGATLCGSVSVADFAMVGAGATVLPRVQIGEGAVVGAGSVLTKNLKEGQIAFGVPARVRREHPGA